MDYAWTCRCCGQRFNTLPLGFSCNVPEPWLAIPQAERDARGQCSSDLCVIDGEHFFVRGCLEIPIIGRADKFVWGVWASLSKQNFERILDLWDAADLENEPPMFGWLGNAISIYPKTLYLKTHVHPRAGGARPAIELEATDHPLAIEQRQGISLARVEEIAAALLH
jgi:hypothetical protein